MSAERTGATLTGPGDGGRGQGAADDRRALRDAVRQLLERECSPALVRSGWPDGDGDRVRAVWRQLAGMGALGILVDSDTSPEGLGLDETYLVGMVEEAGYAGLPMPSAEFAAGVGLLAGSPAQAELLAAVLRGDRVLTVAQAVHAPVPFGEIADAVLVLDRGEVRLVQPGPQARTPVGALDGGRRLGRVDLAGGQRLAVGEAAVTTARRRGALATAAELVGLSRRMLRMTVEYVRVREQFGVAIGSFQAVKHHLADCLLAIEFAAPLVATAATAMAAGAATADRDVSMAKAVTSDAARLVARHTLQCHGAMAYTTEYDHHLFAKRAWAQAAAWGTANQHRAIVAAALGLADQPPGEGIVP